MKGLFVVNKSKDWTSFDVVNFFKHKLKMKQVGHLGTLDPMATGVLVVTVGSATKIFDLFLSKSKTYIAEFEFGYETDTLDTTGRIVATTNNIPQIEDIKSVLSQYVGDVMQLPPQYSAKKVDGKKSCDVARSGGELMLKPCKIHIEDIKILSYENKILKLEIECGAGTYIRAIGRDIAKSLNSLATMSSLVRTKVGKFKIEDSFLLDKSDACVEDKMLPLDVVFSDFDKIEDERLAWRLINGQTVKADVKDGKYRLYDRGEFVALCNAQGGNIKMEKYFA